MCCAADGGSPRAQPSEAEDVQPSSQPFSAVESGGTSGLLSADAEAVLDKLTMMEKRQDSVNAENKHQLLSVKAQYDSLGERLGAIEQTLQGIVAAREDL